MVNNEEGMHLQLSYIVNRMHDDEVVEGFDCGDDESSRTRSLYFDLNDIAD